MEVRAITDAEVDAFRDSLMETFGSDAEVDPEGSPRFRALIAPGQAWAAFDRGLLVATAATFELEMGMPGGGSLPFSGLTMVSVRPTHRRRGILRELIRLHLEDSRAKGRAMSGLWATEPAIYTRFGYALASHSSAITIRDAHELAITGAGDDVAWIDEGRARELLPDVYVRATAQRPGVLRRTAMWWRERRFLETSNSRRGASRRRHVIVTRGAEVTGYVAYRQREGWRDGLADGKVEIIELIGVDTRATASLWAYICALDLFPNVSWSNAPVDDPLPWLANDPRRIGRGLVDALWLRFEDVRAVLAARNFDDSVALRVGDRIYGRGPEVAVAPQALPALVLGAARATELAHAGLLTGDVPAAERAFATPLASWCPEIF